MSGSPSSPPSSPYKYLSGFGSHFETEARAGALPIGQNSPQICAYGLYAEQVSGTAFTVPRHQQQRSWLYRLRPSVCHGAFKRCLDDESKQVPSRDLLVTPEQLRWRPFPLLSGDDDSDRVDWLQGLKTVAGAGDVSLKCGLEVYVYSCNSDMVKKSFYSSDGDFLIVPQHGTLDIQTEFGYLDVKPGEICVIQRGILFSVRVPDGPSRGYAVEVFEGHFELPSLGPIGANGLANPRDFLTPVAAYDDVEGEFTVVNKYLSQMFMYTKDHSPYNVVAWHGNYAPYKYNLEHFNTMNSVSFDHADPSIFTVLTCPSARPGVAVCDFVIFPWRWTVAEHSFRPPYYHRNCMSEFMGLIKGVYEAKQEGFMPGGASLHSCMTPHGPDTSTFVGASRQELIPHRLSDQALAFMFESTYMMKVSHWARHSESFIDENYLDCWQGLTKALVTPPEE